jgi:hypothetical protein
MRRIPIGKQKVKLYLFVNEVILSLGTLQVVFKKRLLDLIKKFKK